jgi:hypothetical protein
VRVRLHGELVEPWAASSLSVRPFRHCFANLAILDGARSKHDGKQFVATLSFNTKVVNRSAPDLLAVTDMINKQFIPAAITSRQAHFPAGSKSDRTLKSNSYLPSMTSH